MCSVFPFVKNVADSMDFDSSLQLLAMCVWETGNSLCFTPKIQAHDWLVIHRETWGAECWRPLPFGFHSLFCSCGLSSWGTGVWFEALTLLPEEGCNLVLKSFSSSYFCFHALLCSLLLNSLDMKILFIYYLRIWEFKYKPENSTVDCKILWSQHCAF